MEKSSDMKIVHGTQIFLLIAVSLTFCDKDPAAERPLVETLPIQTIDSTTMIFYGNVVNEGSSAVFKRGFCWSENPDAEINDNFIIRDFGLGVFSFQLTLKPGTTYFVKSFAENSSGTSFGNEISFRTGITEPILAFGAVERLLNNSCSLTCQLISNGGLDELSTGIYWSIDQSTVLDGDYLIGKQVDDFFLYHISPLKPSTKYYYSILAENEVGKSFTDIQSFTTPGRNILVLDGDSRTDGWNCYSRNPYMDHLVLKEEFLIFKTSEGGLASEDIVIRAPEQIFHKKSDLARLNIVVIWIGVNDIAVLDKPANYVFSNLKNYCSLLRSSGWTVIVCTEVSMKGAGSHGECDDIRQALNAMITSEWPHFADSIADLGSNPAIGKLGAYRDTSVFCDGIHLTDKGMQIVSEIISTTLNEMSEK